MSALTREQLMKELLPGMQDLFGLEMEAQEVARVKKSIGKGDEPFIPRDVYQRVIADYEKKMERRLEEEARRIKMAIHKGRSEGIRRAADYVEVMAEELGQSNLLHAVVLAILNMEVEE